MEDLVCLKVRGIFGIRPWNMDYMMIRNAWTQSFTKSQFGAPLFPRMLVQLRPGEYRPNVQALCVWMQKENTTEYSVQNIKHGLTNGWIIGNQSKFVGWILDILRE